MSFFFQVLHRHPLPLPHPSASHLPPQHTVLPHSNASPWRLLYWESEREALRSTNRPKQFQSPSASNVKTEQKSSMMRTRTLLLAISRTIQRTMASQWMLTRAPRASSSQFLQNTVPSRDASSRILHLKHPVTEMRCRRMKQLLLDIELLSLESH